MCLAGAVIGCVVYLARTLTQLGLVAEPKGGRFQANRGALKIMSNVELALCLSPCCCC